MSDPAVLDRIRIVLCQPSHPGNIGAVARAMKTMGFDRLALVAPRLFPHPDADARASGAASVLRAARVVDHLDEALAGTRFACALSGRRRDLTPHRGATILTLGILSIVLSCIIIGPMAWVMGNNDLAEIRAGRMDPEGEGLTRAGQICGIIGTVFGVLFCCYLGFIGMMISAAGRM